MGRVSGEGGSEFWSLLQRAFRSIVSKGLFFFFLNDGAGTWSQVVTGARPKFNGV